MKRRSSKVHGRKKNIKETILIFLGILIILFLVFSVTRAIVKRGIKKIAGGEETQIKLVVKTPKGAITYPKKTPSPTPVHKIVIKNTPPKKSVLPTPLPKKKVTPASKKEKKEGVSTPKKGSFYIQLGAFKSKANADNLAKSVKKLGYKVAVIKAGKLYKVRIPGFSIRKDALNELDKLKDKGFEGFVGKQ